MIDGRKPSSKELMPVPVDELPGSTDLSELGIGAYYPPDGLVELAAEEHNGRRHILYVGDVAMVDVVGMSSVVEDVVIPELLLLRVSAPLDQALDALHNTQRYAPEAEARRVFDKAA